MINILYLDNKLKYIKPILERFIILREKAFKNTKFFVIDYSKTITL